MRAAVLAVLLALAAPAARAQRPAARPSGATQRPPAAPRPASEPGTAALPDAPIPDTAAVQNTPPRLVLVARRVGSTVTMRWAPSTPRLWATANDSGYVVERLVPAATRGGAATRTRLTPEPLRPWPLETFRQRAPQGDRFAPIAAQMLYGQSAIPEARSPGYELIVRSADLSNRHGFALFAADLSTVAADGLALRFVDEAAPEGPLLYTVRMARPALPLPLDTTGAMASVLVPPGDTPPLAAPEGVEVREGDGAIGLRWPALGEAGPGGDGAFTAFWVERDGGAGFQPMHETPLAATVAPDQPYVVFTDSAVVNYRRYRYRVTGVDAFAQRSAPAEVEAMPRDRTAPPPPRITRIAHLRESTVQIDWEPNEDAAAPDLRGYRIGVAEHPEGPFLYADTWLPPSARSATDSRAVSGTLNYYTVAAVDTAGNAGPATAVYAQLIDSVGPSRPVGLTYTAALLDAGTGIVTLRWTRGPEPDLLAYRVFRANEAGHVFTLDAADPVADTTYADTLDVRTLTRAVYYRLVALDRNYNPSDSSAMLRVVLPDVVPPAPPVFTEALPSDSTVALAWLRSPSDDVARQRLLRAALPDTTWQPLASLAPDDEAYTDRAVARGETYLYTLVAEDSTGLRSDPAVPMRARPYDAGLRPAVQHLRAAATAEGIRIEWDVPTGTAAAPEGGEASPYWFVLYRADGPDGLLRRLRSTGTTPAATDRPAPGTYRYAVQVVHRDGGASPISAPVQAVQDTRRR